MKKALQASTERVLQVLRDPHVVQEPHYMTAEEAARYLRYASTRALYKAVAAHGIPHRRRGGKTFLFVRAELDQWLEGTFKPRRTDLWPLAPRRSWKQAAFRNGKGPTSSVKRGPRSSGYCLTKNTS